MTTAYVAILSDTASQPLSRQEFPTILDCVKWAERFGQPADCVDIYGVSGNRVSQYRQPRPGTYPAALGVWVNAKIYE
jgi:hypothetical protein